VLILEASDRWGGRIRVLEGFADFPVELGAEEIHGDKSDWYKLVKKTSGLKFANDDSSDYFWLDNSLKSEAQFMADPDGNKAYNFVESARQYAGTDKTVLQHLDAQGIAARVRHFANARLGNEYGTSNDRLSIKGIAEEDRLWTAGDRDLLVANRSYKQVIEAHFQTVLGKIMLNTAVKSIDYSQSKVKISDAAGTEYEADHVLLTVPLTVLRDGDIQFTPALPAEKTAAFQKIGMGAGMKIVLKFSQRFWAPDTGSIYGAGIVPEYWYTSAGRGTTPVLTAFVMGEKAEQLGALSTDGAVQAVLADLDGMYGSSAASSRWQDAHVMDWAKMPYVRGAYSYPIVGGGIAQREKLAAPVAGKLFFAGEATNAQGHSGTMHGAYESAARAVQEIIG
jgi:monoamine oxidase